MEEEREEGEGEEGDDRVVEVELVGKRRETNLFIISLLDLAFFSYNKKKKKNKVVGGW